MKSFFLLITLVTFFSLVLFVVPVGAQLTDLKTQIRQSEVQRTTSPTPSQTREVVQNPVRRTQTSTNSLEEQSRNVQDLLNRVGRLENNWKNYTGNPQVNNWLGLWWQVGFWTGLLWIFLWLFVGWQWTNYKFWGFGWPWPGWFWLPLFWFIPWLWFAWQWWLDWWVWWVWIWWLFPWVFWIFWWIILFKESTLWVWRRTQA